MEVIYETKINDLGDKFEDFLDQKMIILFKDNAPDQLSEYCILHSENNLKKKIKKGDILQIAKNEYKVTAVGSVVNENLDNLGHITLRFDGSKEADLDGSLYLEDKELPNISVDEQIKIVRS